MNLDEFVSDYVAMLKDNGEPMPPRKKLAREIATAAKDYGIEATPEQIEYYL